MEQNDIQEINESYLGVLTKIELLNDSMPELVTDKNISYIERDFLEVAAKYDIYADEYKDEFARSRQRIIDRVRKLTAGKSLGEKVSILKRLRRKESEFVKENS